MISETKVTATVKQFLMAIMSEADAQADSDSADAVSKLADELTVANDTLENKATALREGGQKMMQIIAACVEESGEVDRLTNEISAAAPSDGDRWAVRTAMLLNVVVGYVDGMRPTATTNINGSIPTDGDIEFVSGKGSTATVSRAGKVFLRITGTDEGYYFNPDSEGRWGTAAIVARLHSELAGVRLRFPLRSDAADEIKTGKNGQPNYVQKVAASGVNLPRILADRFDKRFYATPLTAANAVEYGRQLADGSEEIILTANVVKVIDCPEGSVDKNANVAEYVCVSKGTDSAYYPVGVKGTPPTHLESAELKAAFMLGRSFVSAGEQLAVAANVSIGDDDGDEEIE